MGFDGIGHAAVYVEDLEAIERVYVELFDMTVEYREGLVDGERTRLPDAGWEENAMVADRILNSFVRRGGLGLSLHEVREGVPKEGPLDHLNLQVSRDERERIVETAPEFGCNLDVRPYEGDYRYVQTPDNIVWELEPVE